MGHQVDPLLVLPYLTLPVPLYPVFLPYTTFLPTPLHLFSLLLWLPANPDGLLLASLTTTLTSFHLFSFLLLFHSCSFYGFSFIPRFFLVMISSFLSYFSIKYVSLSYPPIVIMSLSLSPSPYFSFPPPSALPVILFLT